MLKTCQTTSLSTSEITSDQLHSVIFRVLCVNWKEQMEGTMFLEGLAETMCKSYQCKSGKIFVEDLQKDLAKELGSIFFPDQDMWAFFYKKLRCPLFI